ncbi:MAG: transposase [Aggregatilineales bacterium]
MGKSKGTRYSEEQIIRILHEIEGGKTLAEVCRQYQVAEGTVYRWRTKYGGMEPGQLQRLRELEAENGRLKKIVAQQALDIDGLLAAQRLHHRLELELRAELPLFAGHFLLHRFLLYPFSLLCPRFHPQYNYPTQ